MYGIKSDKSSSNSLPAICRLIAVVAILAFLAGCAAPQARTVREAQDAYSKAAQLDLQRKLHAAQPGQTDEGLVDPGDPVNDPDQYYELAFGLVTEALRENEKNLKADHLWGTALAIKAFSAWRLGDTKAARQECDKVVTQSRSENEEGTRIWPRDIAMCDSLRSLIDIDNLGIIAVSFEYKAPSDQELETFLKDARNTLNTLNTVDSNLPDNHPYTIYLAAVRSELAYDVQTGVNNLGSQQRERVGTDVVDSEIRNSALGRWEVLSNTPEYESQRSQIRTYQAYYNRLLGA